MDIRALGLLETFGLVPAIEGADTAVKAAEVEITGIERIGAGLVTVKFRGDVSSVQAAMDAACAAAARLGEVRFHTVIARTGDDLSLVLDGIEPSAPSPPPAPASVSGPDAPPEPALQSQPGQAAGEGLEAMRVTQLRQLARSLKGFPLSRKKIKYARKEELIAKITAYKQGREA